MGHYSPHLPLVIALAGVSAALIVWASPGTDDPISLAFAIAGMALALLSIVVALVQ
jgi:hypothetical protein